MAQAAASSDSAVEEEDKVLLFGVTGITGRSALEGLLAGGLRPGQLIAATRSPDGSAAAAVAQRGLSLVRADLDDAASVEAAVKGVKRVYCHALSGDASTADPSEVRRARVLAAAAAAAGVQHLVYNSSGGKGSNAGISQMDQKHEVEDVFRSANVPLTALQATMFMEEFWKKYTRPQILKGTFPFSLPGNTKLQLVAARDIGYAAAVALINPQPFLNQAIEMAGDALTPTEMCQAFSVAQGGMPVKHSSPPAWLIRLFFGKDLYRICMFLRNTGYSADLARCRAAFPDMLTFEQFLQQTGWGDASRTYEQGMIFPDTPSAAAATPAASANQN